MILSLVLLAFTGMFYLSAFVIHAWAIRNYAASGHQRASWMMRFGFFTATLYGIIEAIRLGSLLPVMTLSGALFFFSWCLAFVYLVFLSSHLSRSFGVLLSPLLAGFVFAALVAFVMTQGAFPQPVPAYFRNPFFEVHILSVFFAYASFSLSFAAAVLYEVQHHRLKRKKPGGPLSRLPSLEELERLVTVPLWGGVPLLMLTLSSGFVWSEKAFGEYWLLDAKTLSTMLGLCLYAGILFSRYFFSLRGRKIAFWSLVGYSWMMLSFLGLRLLQGVHHYAR